MYQLISVILVTLLTDPAVQIPDYQRLYVWSIEKARKFIDSIMKGLPAPAIFLYQEIQNNALVKWIEDGQQRYTTVKKFMNNEFTWNDKYYKDFTPQEKIKFDCYLFNVTVLENMAFEERIELFQRLQENKPLSNGDKYHAYKHLPALQQAYSLMSNPGCIEVFGEKKDTKTRTFLANLMAFVGGLAFPDIKYMTTSFEMFGNALLTTVIDDDLVEERLTKLISVFKRADKLYPVSVVERRKQWNVGLYIGYILYTMRLPDRNWENDKEMWAQYIARVRKDKSAMSILNYKKPASRNWAKDRWEQGLKNVENPDQTLESIRNDVYSQNSSDSEED